MEPEQNKTFLLIKVPDMSFVCFNCGKGFTVKEEITINETSIIGCPNCNWPYYLHINVELYDLKYVRDNLSVIAQDARDFDEIDEEQKNEFLEAEL